MPASRISIPQRHGAPESIRVARGGRQRRRLIIGAVIALPLGAALGYLAQPNLAMIPGAPVVVAVPARPAALLPRPVAAETIPDENLETSTISPDGLSLPPPPPPLPPLRGQVARPRPPVLPAPGPTAQTRPARGPGAEPSPSFNCRFSQSRAEQMICDDPDLAAADRRLNDAYEQAIASGVPRRALRQEQDRWLSIRDEAAKDSPRAVAQAYAQRIAELLEIADVPG